MLSSVNPKSKSELLRWLSVKSAKLATTRMTIQVLGYLWFENEGKDEMRNLSSAQGLFEDNRINGY
jgi:hypothetical protein